MADDYLWRDQQLLRLRRESFDLAVIGGGINGAAVARDAALRGLRVALIDRGDFAGQTSSRSSKLIHGGLRYLPQGRLRLVYEALTERERLSRLTAPHLVRPIEFLYPVYAGRTMPRLALWTGLFFYDLFARTARRHRFKPLSAARVAEIEPQLTGDGLRGGALYHDGHGDDARLTLENVIDAALHGAAVANYTALEGFDRGGGGYRAAFVRDIESGGGFELRARLLVNATGPWIDWVRRLEDSACAPAARLTKGVHLVVDPERVPVRHSLVLPGGDGRIVFVIRERASILIGTTDTDYHGELAALRADRADADYLLAVVRGAIPSAAVRREDIMATFAGVRVLSGGGDQAPSSVSREELMMRSASGMISIGGGKLTTHRHIAERVVNLICRELGRQAASPTATVPLPGARPNADCVEYGALDAAARAELFARYGTRAGLIASIVCRDPAGGEALAEGCPVLRAEVVHAIRFEMARTLEDFMVRRTAIARLWPAYAASAAAAAAPLMAAELGWSAERERCELARFETMLQASREF